MPQVLGGRQAGAAGGAAPSERRLEPCLPRGPCPRGAETCFQVTQGTVPGAFLTGPLPPPGPESGLAPGAPSVSGLA